MKVDFIVIVNRKKYGLEDVDLFWKIDFYLFLLVCLEEKVVLLNVNVSMFG